jgi:hypothetical protein
MFSSTKITNKKPLLWCLYLVPLTIFSHNAQSMGLTDQKYSELGGTLSSDATTVQQVDDTLLQNSLTHPYWNVGLLISSSYCTGTWIGKDDTHAFILTAAHCVTGDSSNEYTGEHISFRTADGRLVASGTSTSYFNNYIEGDFSHCENDIAIAKIPLLSEPQDDQGNATEPPYLDGTHANNFDGLLNNSTQLAGYGILGSPSLGQVRSVGRRQGVGRFISRTNGCLFNQVSEENPNEWAFSAPGDSGSATWQTFDEQPVVVSVTSWWMGWQGYASGHGAISANIEWVKSIAPMAKIYTGSGTPRFNPDVEPETPKLTFDTPLEFDPVEAQVRGTVYYLPSTGVIDGPTRRIWRYPSGYSALTVTLIHAETGETHPVIVRAQRLTHCGWGQMNNGAWCYPKADLGTLKVSFSQYDNPDLPLGQYEGQFEINAKGWHQRQFEKTYVVNANIQVEQPLPIDGVITANQSYESAPYDSQTFGTVYYLASEVSRVKRPRWHGRLNRSTRLNVPVVNRETGETHYVKLRAQRYLGCGWSTMNNAAYCSTDDNRGQLKVYFRDRENRRLPDGEYEGAFSVLVQGLHNKDFTENLRLRVEIRKGGE